jgi:hypothetical protein
MKGEKTGGRTKGTPNKLGTKVKDNVIEVFSIMQEEETTSLLGWARNNLTEFYTKIYTKLITQTVDLTGEIEQTVTRITVKKRE